MDKEALDRLAKKRQYKLRGVIASIEFPNKSIAHVLVSKGSGQLKKYFIFSAFGANAYAFAELKKGFRIKIWFTIKAVQYKDKWYTNLVIESFEHWVVNEDKIKKQAKIEEAMKKQQQFDWGNENFENL